MYAPSRDPEQAGPTHGGRNVTQPRNERPTLAEVADAAGVSRATVSKVLNGRHDVSPETRSRVEQLLSEHAYVRRTTPRAIDGSTPTARAGLDLVVDTLLSPYTLEVIRGVSEAADEAGLELVLTQGGEDGGDHWAERVAGAGRHGVILVTSALSSTPAPGARRGRRAAGPDRPAEGARRRAERGRDELGGRPRGHGAPDRPRASPHRRPGRPRRRDERRRARARISGGARERRPPGRHRPHPLRRLRRGDRAREHVQAAAPRRPPSAIFATSDPQAFGALVAARECGRRRPVRAQRGGLRRHADHGVGGTAP